ncbi:hypothetical protein C3384_14765 [Klebsiella aerogenes]|nr:hypothetical protein C3384_14765 [Klebsiella aerogenes]
MTEALQQQRIVTLDRGGIEPKIAPPSGGRLRSINIRKMLMTASCVYIAILHLQEMLDTIAVRTQNFAHAQTILFAWTSVRLPEYERPLSSIPKYTYRQIQHLKKTSSSFVFRKKPFHIYPRGTISLMSMREINMGLSYRIM